MNRPIAAATGLVRNVYVEYVHPTATPKRQVRIAKAASLTAKAGTVAFAFGLRDQDAVNLQLLGGVWILQIFPAVAVGLFTGRLHPRALLAGWGAGMLAGTFLVVREGFASLGGGPFQIYAGLVALVLNLTVALAGTAALERLGADQSDLPSRLTVRRRPETGANTRLALRLGRIGRGGGTAASLPRPHP